MNSRINIFIYSSRPLKSQISRFILHLVFNSLAQRSASLLMRRVYSSWSPSNLGILIKSYRKKINVLNETHVKTKRNMSCSIEYPGGSRRCFESQMVLRMQDFTSSPKLERRNKLQYEANTEFNNTQSTKFTEMIEQLPSVPMAMIVSMVLNNWSGALPVPRPLTCPLGSGCGPL